MRRIMLILLLGLISQLWVSCSSPPSTNTGGVIKSKNTTYEKVKPASLTPSGEGIYKIEDAGIQFEVPKDWKVERADNGQLIVSTPDNFLALTLESIETDKVESKTQEYKNRLHQQLTDINTVGDPEKTTNNDLTVIGESGLGKIDGNTNQWSIDIIMSEKAVIIYALSSMDVFNKYESSYEKLMDSIKKTG
jgi:hypothetical protein